MAFSPGPQDGRNALRGGPESSARHRPFHILPVLVAARWALSCAFSRTNPGVSKQAPLLRKPQLVTGEDPVSLRKPGLASCLSDRASVLSVACGQSEGIAEKHHSLGKG